MRPTRRRRTCDELATARVRDAHRVVTPTATGFVDVPASLPELAEACDDGQVGLLAPSLTALHKLAAKPSAAQPYAREPECPSAVSAASKGIDVGLNLSSYAAEGAATVPDRPQLFSTFPVSLIVASGSSLPASAAREVNVRVAPRSERRSDPPNSQTPVE